MANNPFTVLGVNESVTQNELFDAYRELRNKYSNLRFSPGQEGADACKRLQEIEEAYNEASDMLRTRYDISYSGDLGKVEEAIRAGRMNEAQEMLDADHNRTAKWHYLQSVIFYKKGWMSDSLKQLEFACNMEPGNTEYRTAYEKLTEKMRANSGHSDTSFYGGKKESERTYEHGPRQDTMGRGCTPCDCCSSLICADCCCECCGADLISCC